MESLLSGIELSYLRQENREIVLELLLTNISQNDSFHQEENLFAALLDGDKRSI